MFMISACVKALFRKILTEAFIFFSKKCTCRYKRISEKVSLCFLSTPFYNSIIIFRKRFEAFWIKQTLCIYSIKSETLGQREEKKSKIIRADIGKGRPFITSSHATLSYILCLFTNKVRWSPSHCSPTFLPHPPIFWAAHLPPHPTSTIGKTMGPVSALLFSI